MRIQILTTFLDGRDRFEVGDIRTVSDADGARFLAAGWARLADGTDAPSAPPAVQAASVDLTIHSSTIGLGDNHG